MSVGRASEDNDYIVIILIAYIFIIINIYAKGRSYILGKRESIHTRFIY